MSPIMQELRAAIIEYSPECKAQGSMHSIHDAALQWFDDRRDSLTKRECFALGEVYQSGSTDSALYALDALDES